MLSAFCFHSFSFSPLNNFLSYIIQHHCLDKDQCFALLKYAIEYKYGVTLSLSDQGTKANMSME